MKLYFQLHDDDDVLIFKDMTLAAININADQALMI